jgi:hypothetical protein
MNPLDQIKQDFLAECADDFVGVWSLLRTVNFTIPNLTSIESQGITLRLLEDLLRAGTIIVLQISNSRLEAWNSPPASAVKRIKDEWDALGRDPDVGEIAWFTLPMSDGKLAQINERMQNG